MYYNTTGVEIAGTTRQRPKISGYARFHACGGFDPHRPSRVIGRVFECADPASGRATTNFSLSAFAAPEKPDAFLGRGPSKLNGVLSVGSDHLALLRYMAYPFSECGASRKRCS